ncbi:aminotransferase class V-fold PLP-dependent enzyme [Sorangium sp. So ce128]|uniref:aminotransferase class V-fold PLP-dependent enzyme n=1 Tax=Sorangium sp. So ce128 TaxID=3133281 RepID=UPI003F647B75
MSIASLVDSRPAAGAPAPPALGALPLPVVGADLSVPLVTGERVGYVNLDYAASAPCLRSVLDAVAALLPWYSSVHRGAGFASTVTTELYAAARQEVADFVGARDEDTVVFTRNTTDALNLLAAALPEDTTVVMFASEHHANQLPWRRGRSVVLPVPASADEAIARADGALRGVLSRHRLLAVTGASNVTGELWPLPELAAVAHRHGARLAVDAAQLAPHRAIELAGIGADYVALSGHKLYAPFGGGVLVGRGDWLDAARPYLAGGGAVRRVTHDGVEWASGAPRHEAGTPNVVGAVSLAAACRALSEVGMSAVAAHEASLLDRVTRGLCAVPGVERLAMWGPESPRIGVVTFNVRGLHPGAVAAALSAEHGIGVRDGSFCAHPLMTALAGDRAPEASGSAAAVPLAVRASFGVGTSAADIDRFLLAIAELVARGPRWRYRLDGGRHVPDPDPRPRPALAGLLAGGAASAALGPLASQLAPCQAPP